MPPNANAIAAACTTTAARDDPGEDGVELAHDAFSFVRRAVVASARPSGSRTRDGAGTQRTGCRVAASRTAHGGQPLRGVGDDPLPRIARGGGPWDCGPQVGDGSRRSARRGRRRCVYVVVMRGFVDRRRGPRPRLAAARCRCRCSCSACGCSRSRRRGRPCSSRGAATAMAVGSAYETFVQQNPELILRAVVPALQPGRADRRRGRVPSAFLIMFATFPTGVPERRWQRIAVGFVWVPRRSSGRSRCSRPRTSSCRSTSASAATRIPNPFAVPWLEWAAPAVHCARLPAVAGVLLGTRRARARGRSSAIPRSAPARGSWLGSPSRRR